MDISIIIVNWNTKQLLLNCLASIQDAVKGLSSEIWVIDNGSSDGSVELVREIFPAVHIIANRTNCGFARANNQALRRIAGRYAMLLNSDTILKKDSIVRIFEFMAEHPAVGLCCGQLLDEDGSRQNSIANFPTLISMVVNETILRLLLPKKYPSKRQKYDKPVLVDSCIGACLMVRKEAIQQVGLLDERYFFFFEETDWAKSMAEKGWRSALVPDAEIYHLQGKSVGCSARGRIMFHYARLLYFNKWHPGSPPYPLLVSICIVRVFFNVLLNLLATAVTLGMARSVRQRLIINWKIFIWYLGGGQDPNPKSSF